MADIDVGAILEALNNKADIDFNNVGNAGKNAVTNWGIPDYSAGVNISGDTFAAPSDGFILFEAGATTANGGGGSISVDGTSIDALSTTSCTVVTRKFAWVAKGSVVTFVNGAQGNTKIFYPLRGA